MSPHILNEDELARTLMVSTNIISAGALCHNLARIEVWTFYSILADKNGKFTLLNRWFLQDTDKNK